MNILIITTEVGANGGGLALSCSRLIDLLSKEHHVQLSLSTDYPIVTTSGGYNLALELRISKEYKLKQDTITYKGIDVIIGFGGGFNGYYASLLAEKLKARFIINFRGSDINLSKWSVEESWYNSEACRRACKIICLSNEMVRNVLSLSPLSSDKVVIIPNELSLKSKVTRFPNLPNKVVLGCAAAHLNEKKGIGNLLYMISKFKSTADTHVSLELVGDIDDDLRRHYFEIIKELHIEENIVFHGYKTRQELAQTMLSWDFYIQASVCEGNPNVVSESLLNGLAFISTKTGYVSEILCDDFPELFFDSFEPQMMSAKLLKLINRHDLAEIYHHAYNVLEAKIKKQEVVEKWQNILSDNTPYNKELIIDNILAICLHDVCGEIHDSITTPYTVFQHFVDFIHENGYGLCSMKDYIKKSREERKHYIVCTFDDGYKSLASIAMPILSKYGFSATVFVCTSLIGNNNQWNCKDAILRQHLNENDILVLYENGWEIASHGVSHSNLLKLSDIDLDYELSESKRILSKMCGEVFSYAYPYGSYNIHIEKCVTKYYKYAFALSQGGTSLAVDRLQIKRYSISDIYKMLSTKL